MIYPHRTHDWDDYFCTHHDNCFGISGKYVYRPYQDRKSYHSPRRALFFRWTTGTQYQGRMSTRLWRVLESAKLQYRYRGRKLYIADGTRKLWSWMRPVIKLLSVTLLLREYKPFKSGRQWLMSHRTQYPQYQWRWHNKLLWVIPKIWSVRATICRLQRQCWWRWWEWGWNWRNYRRWRW